jgi:glycine C-acetyltransferase
MTDLFSKLLEHRGPLGQYAEVAHGYYAFPKLSGEIGSRMIFQGKERIVWSLNNYLGLANHPEVRKADADAAAEWGMAYPMGARIMSGESIYHEQLEQELATFVGKEKGLLLNFGYQGILSIIDTLLGRHDVVVYDKDSHACIYDGVRLHLGKRFPFEHNNFESFKKQIERATEAANQSGGGILVISEGVFGMRGNQGILKEIASLKDQYGFRFLVDDAHGFGMLGKTGAGACEEQGVTDKVDVYFSTFAKSMATIGAFTAGDKDVINYLRYNMRSQIFAKSVPMPIVIGALKRLELLRGHPELREKLWHIVNLLQSGLRAQGLDLGSTNSCVTPVFLKCSVEETGHLVHDMRENHNIFCSVVMFPMIPKGMILLRLIPTADHTEEDVEKTLAAFKSMKQRLDAGEYQKELQVIAQM